MSDLFVNTNLETETQAQETLAIVNVQTSPLDINLKAKELNPLIDWAITQRRTNLVNNLIDLQSHSSVSVRRKVAGGISRIAAQSDVARLQTWQARESDRQVTILLESAIDSLNRQSSNSTSKDEAKVLTVGEAITLIKKNLSERTYTIEGELSDIKLMHNMYYLALKDSQDTRLDCRILANNIAKLDFPLNEGLAVRITGRFTLSKYAKLTLDIHHIQLTGEGELRRNLQILEKKLDREGLFDIDSKKSIPILPSRVLLIASTASAAVGDFLKVLKARRCGINIYQLPIKTQGVGAEGEIVSKLEQVNQLCREYRIETVVITRGGGSKDDLFVFNSEKVVRAVAAINCPVIAAIGHEQDQTLVEKVADLRASTPSNAAELVSISTTSALQWRDRSLGGIRVAHEIRSSDYRRFTLAQINAITAKTKIDLQQAHNQARAIDITISRILREVKHQSQYLCQSITQNIRVSLYHKQSQNRSLRFGYQQLSQIKDNRVSYLSSFSTILNQINYSFEQDRNTLGLLSSQIALHDTANILAKGFAIIRQNGKIIEKVGELKEGALSIEMQDGEMNIANQLKSIKN